MSRWLALVFLLIVAAGASPANAAAVEIPGVTISGGDLPFAVSLASSDADAFTRRLNPPPRIDFARLRGSSYKVFSDYWDGALRREDDETNLEVGPQADYYPADGYVKLELGSDEVVIVIDLRQRAILNRYIEQARDGLIVPTPGALGVLANAMQQETVGLEVAGALVDADTARDLAGTLAAVEPAFLDPAEPPRSSDDGYWLVFTLPEGRAQQYYYDGVSVTDLLGTERYDASGAREMLESLAPAAPLAVEQDEPAGSLLWWPVMLAGGLSAIGLAAWLRRGKGPL